MNEVAHDLYYRVGDGPVRYARVWSSVLFLEAQTDAAKREGKEVTVSTKDEYTKQLKKGK